MCGLWKNCVNYAPIGGACGFEMDTDPHGSSHLRPCYKRRKKNDNTEPKKEDTNPRLDNMDQFRDAPAN